MIISVIFTLVHFVHTYMETRPNNNQMWLGFIRLNYVIYQSRCSAVFQSLQVHSTHSVMTHFQRILKSSWFWRSLVDNSCPNHQTPCWGTEERYKHTKTNVTVNAHSPNLHPHMQWYTGLLTDVQFCLSDYWSIRRSGDHWSASWLLQGTDKSCWRQRWDSKDNLVASITEVLDYWGFHVTCSQAQVV